VENRPFGAGLEGAEGEAKPISYLGAAAFQWVNPKAWIMAIGAISTYTPMQGYFTNVMVIAAVFAMINLPSVGVWAACGTLLRNVLKDRAGCACSTGAWRRCW
jgi:threonine/homoserine/homoserine lactone efflux protein